MRRMPRAVSRDAVGGQPSTAGKAVSMGPSRTPQRVASVLAPLSAAFRFCPQGRHFRLLCWLWVSLLCARDTGYAEATRARPAAPLAFLEPAASAACWLLGCC